MLSAFPTWVAHKRRDTTLRKRTELGFIQSASLSSATIAELTSFRFGESNRSPNVANPSARSINTERARIFIYRTDETTITSSRFSLEPLYSLTQVICLSGKTRFLTGCQGNPDRQLV